MQGGLRSSRRAVDILIVDNDRDTTDTLADVLTSVRHKVAIADSGSEALDFMKRNPLPRLILLDPLMGGLELLSYREGSKWEQVPLILLSDLCIAAPLPGCWIEQVLNRPIDLYKLLASVDQTLKRL